MYTQSTVHSHIDITDTLVRLYVFLAQQMDRCVSEAARISYPEVELHAHLASTRATILDMLSVNQVVRGKVEQECLHVLALCHDVLSGAGGKALALEKLNAQRALLKHKIMALSDLLAVFRAV
jgi:hypothetical protein